MWYSAYPRCIINVLANSAPSHITLTEKFPLLTRTVSTETEQAEAILDMLTLVFEVSHVNLVAASDPASVLHARAFQTAVNVLGVGAF